MKGLYKKAQPLLPSIKATKSDGGKVNKPRADEGYMIFVQQLVIAKILNASAIVFLSLRQQRLH